MISVALQLRRYAGVACAAACLFACESGGDDDFSNWLNERSDMKDCLGAFTPNSEVCWDRTEIDDGPISTNTTKSEEFLADVEGQDRCLQIGVPTPGTPGTMTLSFTTTAVKGTYFPKNCGAAWIEDAQGQYVRTLEVWAGERVQSVTMWFPRACQKDATLTRPDVITGATLDDHSKPHTTKPWDGKDFRGAVAPDGKYTLWLQITESEFVPEGPYNMIPFEKGKEPWELTPQPMPGFSNIVLKYQPGAAPPPGATQTP